MSFIFHTKPFSSPFLPQDPATPLFVQGGPQLYDSFVVSENAFLFFLFQAT